MVFLSHPIELKNNLLSEHLEVVAEKTKKLILDAGFEKKANAGFYCGLLHDIGKLNPYYQELFKVPDEMERVKLKKKLQEKYYPGHSFFSLLVAQRLLSFIDKDSLEQILIVIGGHHTKLSKLSAIYRKYMGPNGSLDEKLLKTGVYVKEKIDSFKEEIKDITAYKELNWVNCEKLTKSYPIPQDYYRGANDNNNNSRFIETSVLFSALLQADRSSFYQANTHHTNLEIDTSALISDSPFANIRSEFQKHALSNLISCFNHNDIVVLEAPTGIGKTKVFLDLIKELKRSNNLERIFYFSPLLALTDDFEEKLKKVTKNWNNILTYTHVFAGTLEEKSKGDDNYFVSEDSVSRSNISKEYIDQECFNKEFIVTTMQRFLITLYSNRHQDKLKLISFRNSLLVLDEIQTMPKFLLRNICALLEVMAKTMGFKVLMVSATVPNEISSFNRVSCPKDIKQKYLQKTTKKIIFDNVMNIKDKARELKPSGKILLMVNTRRKCLDLFKQTNPHLRENVCYLSAGIRKKDRRQIINKIKSSDNLLVVSTQVLEAGVDLSFTSIYRELAPLDNLVQVLGRLNRENESRDKAILYVFKIGNDNYWPPYSELEVKETERILSPEQNVVELYEKLDDYYRCISEKNLKNKNLSGALEDKIARCDFDDVWAFVQQHSFPEDEKETVFIPDKGNKKQWENINNFFMNPKRHKSKKTFMEFTASMPTSIYKLGIQDWFVEELLDKGVLLPKFEYIAELYDDVVGLDKWLNQ